MPARPRPASGLVRFPAEVGVRRLLPPQYRASTVRTACIPKRPARDARDMAAWSGLCARFTSDEAGATEVLGVVLMVAVTVVLATSAAPALMDLTDDVPRPPTATFAFEQPDCDNPATLQVVHVAGESIDASELYLRSQELDLHGSWANPHNYETNLGGDGTVDAGDTATMCAADFSGVAVRVVWRSDSGKSMVLATWRGGE